LENLEYSVFYDECKKDGYWHCFLFIPKNKSDFLFKLLDKPRNDFKYKDFIHYQNIRKKTKYNSPRMKVILTWIYILYYILQQQKLNSVIHWGDKNFEKMDEIFGAKLTIFRQKENLKDMFNKMSYQSKVETTFRMGLKSGLHYLFTNESPIIDKVFVDFKKEDFHKYFNEEKLLEKIKTETRPNILYTKDSKIIPISKKDYKIDCPISTIMQFVDVVIGCFRNIIEQQDQFKARYKVSHLLDDLVSKDTTNFARMKNSKFYKGFSLTDASIINGSWNFEKIRKNVNNLQMTLFDNTSEI